MFPSGPVLGMFSCCIRVSNKGYGVVIHTGVERKICHTSSPGYQSSTIEIGIAVGMVRGLGIRIKVGTEFRTRQEPRKGVGWV